MKGSTISIGQRHRPVCRQVVAGVLIAAGILALAGCTVYETSPSKPIPIVIVTTTTAAPVTTTEVPVSTGWWLYTPQESDSTASVAISLQLSWRPGSGKVSGSGYMGQLPNASGCYFGPYQGYIPSSTKFTEATIVNGETSIYMPGLTTSETPVWVTASNLGGLGGGTPYITLTYPGGTQYSLAPSNQAAVQEADSGWSC